MFIMRLQPDGRGYTYHDDRGHSDFHWSYKGKIRKEFLERIHQLLGSEEFVGVVSGNILSKKGDYLRWVVRSNLEERRIQLFFYERENNPDVLRKI